MRVGFMLCFRNVRDSKYEDCESLNPCTVSILCIETASLPCMGSAISSAGNLGLGEKLVVRIFTIAKKWAY